MEKLREKQEKEISAMTEMIGIFCRDLHRTDGAQLCPECEELLEYVKNRIASCPQGSGKYFCSECKTHCFAPNRRQKIKQIVEYSRPDGLLRSPLVNIRHKLGRLFNAIQQAVCNIL